MQELENKKAALELLQNETNEKLNDYRQQVSIIEKQIEDYNKPELTPMYMDKIYEAIEIGVDGFDFDDTDNYDIEYGIDYDGRVHCESFGFSNASDLVQEVADEVMKLFREAECPDEDDNQKNQD
tara:strand:+ start:66 stop:440 length:375 start_codon:yes stop_codon:yes gene_type:complete